MLLWILMGLGAGVITSLLSVDSRPGSMSDTGWRWIRRMIAGVIGAFAGAYALFLYDPTTRSDGLTLAAAALAGGLWLSWILDVTSSRRRRGEELEHPVSASTPGSLRPADMPAYDVSRQALVEGLTEDAAAHTAGRHAEVGRRFPAVRDRLSRHNPSPSSRLHVALRFWHGWMQARDARWQEDDSPDAISVADWPLLARGVASDLALDRDISDPRIIARFTYAAPSLAHSVRL
jgi:uncharacterized membrane protein YeaQ/YmgE (transglycosylase-associated protein family)